MEKDNMEKDNMEKDNMEKDNELIQETVKFISEYKYHNCAVFFNGGKDSVVLLHLLEKVFDIQENKENIQENKENIQENKKMGNLKIVFVKKDDEFPQILNLVENYNSKYNSIHIYDDMKQAILDIYQKYEISHIFTGIRKGDPLGFQRIQEIDKQWLNVNVYTINPLLEWSYSDIWTTIFSEKIKYCSLYDEGYTSLGEIGNTFKNHLLFNGNGYNPACHLLDGSQERAGRIRIKLPLEYEGIVIHGEKNGKKIGFPTANIETSNILLDNGVYYGTVDFNGKIEKFVMSYGKNTIFKEFTYKFLEVKQENIKDLVESPSTTLEIHIFTLPKTTEDFYGKHLKFTIIGYIRNMEKLETLEKLISMIQRDIKIAEYNLI